MSYYYKHPDQGRVLNSAIIAISEDSFDARLPNIKAQTWSAILNRRHGHNNAQCERLEFIGDAVMYLCVALELYDRYPHASPGLMTNVRAPFVTNLVLSLLAEKIDRRAARKGSILQPVLNVRKQVVAHNQEAVIIKTTVPHDTVKVAADTMEMAIGALYMERGLDAVRQWVSRTYDPLFRVAIETHNQTS
ncbi:ribonuclease III [Auriscalpium vulgare]|uniref:Ribonuclease III n=1 Tax=Auriscalpium vulgare TaxID=40419 RepID=A0ACB8SAW0_9AGAM|nr:ribonuclease III [Auriscalpium vulgare]